jgi:hypothetical protein
VILLRSNKSTAMPLHCDANFIALPLSPPPSPTADEDLCIYAAQSPEELSSSSTFGATASTAPRQSSSRVVHPQLPSPRFWVALVLSAAAVGWAGWRLVHDPENQLASALVAFIFALWLPTPV